MLSLTIKCLANSQGRVVVFIFLAVDCFTAIPLLEEVSLKGTVKNLAINVGVSEALVTDDLQEGSATTAWAAENQAHLAGFQHTAEVLQDIELLALLA